ncbi:MAG: PspA/IM30 family protein [Chitinophagia bacterium]|nr:PspA/IM30 family protein [Chitinophagia bacterium]
MGLLQRLFRIGVANANAAMDKLEDEVKMADQIVRELNENLQEALSAAAQIKANALQTHANAQKQAELAQEWENKTHQLLDMQESGKIDAAKANELAMEASKRYEEHTNASLKYKADAQKQDAAIVQLEVKIKSLRDAITEAKHRTELIKSNSRIADASLSINKALSNIDTYGLMATLDRMEAKTTANQFLADAHAEVANTTQSTEQEINKLLGSNASNSALDAIKAKRAAAKASS